MKSLSALFERVDDEEPVFTADGVVLWPSEFLDWLVARGLLQQGEPAPVLRCDACSDGHVEEVQFVEAPENTEVRAYHWCATAGRVPVELSRLRTWVFHFHSLADDISKVLSLAGQTSELVSGRVWLLGRGLFGSIQRDVFLIRGIAWPEGDRLLSRTLQIGNSKSPVILVPHRLPTHTAWQSDGWRIVPLSGVMSLSCDEFSFDRGALDGLWPEIKSIKSPQSSFPTPSDSRWEDVQLTIGDNEFEVGVGGLKKRYTCEEAGFANLKSTGKTADRPWQVLELLAKNAGVFEIEGLNQRERDRLKNQFSAIRKRLKDLVGIDDDPFLPTRPNRTYRSRFRIRFGEGERFPTPNGAQWCHLTITLITASSVRISVETEEVFKQSKRNGIKGPNIAATQLNSAWRDYQLADFQLADSKGKPNRVGRALISLLRSRGKVAASRVSPEFLRLSGILTNFLQIDDPPFEFGAGFWVAQFQCESLDSAR